MYTSVNVHIENGQIVLDEPLVLTDNVKGILTIMEETFSGNPKLEPNGKKLAEILNKIAETRHSYSDTDPLLWQKEIRTDRKIEGRD